MIKILIKSRKKLVLILLLMIIFLLIENYISNDKISDNLNQIKFDNNFLILNSFKTDLIEQENEITKKAYKNAKKLLIFTSTKQSDEIKNLINILNSIRFEYTKISFKKSNEKYIYQNLKLKSFSSNQSIYSVLVFQSLNLFNSIRNESFIRKLIQDSIQLKIGFLFLNENQIIKNEYFIKECNLINEKNLYSITKVDPKKNYFYSSSKSFISLNNLDDKLYKPIFVCNFNQILIAKNKNEENLRQILFGLNLENLFPTLIIDFIDYLSHNQLSIGLDRYIQIDIDDIFVASSGKRMKQNDVYSLIDFQENYLNLKVFNLSHSKFKFNLGYSGYYFKSGNREENLGDQLLLENQQMFNWFDHTWSHQQPHLLNFSTLKEQMLFNYNFAIQNNLPINTFYSVSPHHSGIYPIYENLYTLWSDIWLVKVTSTEEYPHLRPRHLRRGFIFNNIMVLPRQTCGIFTHTIFLNEYPNGINILDQMINGGEVFQTVLHNQINIFMTHMTNYGNDRIGLYLFKNLFDFITEWTNLKMKFLPSIQLGEKYFNLYPQDREPLWTNMCKDKRHMKVWSMNYSACEKLPNFIIIGPQKTGTTALFTYLNLHPSLKSNKMLPVYFEETQFFTNNYNKGVDWYLNLFEYSKNQSVLFFEKSANYFNEPKSALRIKNLLPDVKLVIITIDPVQRAYSWYQHQRFHGDKIANSLSFYEVLTFNSSVNNETVVDGLKNLRQKCLDPGLYFKHLKNWLRYFNKDKIHLVDGELLKKNPYESMNRIQNFLKLEAKVDYKEWLKYDKKKRFFCVFKENNTKAQKKCLGSSKGRVYPGIDAKSKDYLKKFFSKSNFEFLNLLKKMNFDIPIWLKKNKK